MPCNQNNPARLSETERHVLEIYRDRQAGSPFVDRQTSALLDMANAILDADDAAKLQQCQCPYHGRELWEAKTDQGLRILVPLI
jgi:hypothetical protein